MITDVEGNIISTYSTKNVKYYICKPGLRGRRLKIRDKPRKKKHKKNHKMLRQSQAKEMCF